jgi:MoxR-like ATPase
MTEQRMASPADKPVPAKNGEAPLSHGDVAAINDLRASYKKMRDELSRTIIGQSEVIERLLICVLARGHGLLMGVPGLAKTTIVNCISQVMSLQFNRIQFTPDLMPSDITGTDILQETEEPGRRAFVFAKGPVFANIILADEINRTPPKTQSALLEAMQEHRVTVAGRVFPLPSPFFVLATQNPIEQEGTYPLPEAQLDRFMFFIHVDYPSREEEGRIARETTGALPATLSTHIHAAEILAYQEVVQRVPVPDHIYDTAVDLVRRTRPRSDQSPDFVKRWVTWGAGPRAVQYLIRGAKARAVLHGSYLTRVEDLEAVAHPVLTHRILTNFQAQSEGVTSTQIIDRLLELTRTGKQ